jgi:hypothetical protein
MLNIRVSAPHSTPYLVVLASAIELVAETYPGNWAFVKVCRVTRQPHTIARVFRFRAM